MKLSIHQIIAALMELEAKGCHTVHFEFEAGLFRVKIFSGNGKIIYADAMYHKGEQARLDKLANKIETLKNCVTTTVFQCYMRVFIKGEKVGEWEKIKPAFVFGENAMSSMLYDGSGYYVTDPDNDVEYFVDMKKVSEL